MVFNAVKQGNIKDLFHDKPRNRGGPASGEQSTSASPAAAPSAGGALPLAIASDAAATGAANSGAGTAGGTSSAATSPAAPARAVHFGSALGLPPPGGPAAGGALMRVDSDAPSSDSDQSIKRRRTWPAARACPPSTTSQSDDDGKGSRAAGKPAAEEVPDPARQQVSPPANDGGSGGAASRANIDLALVESRIRAVYDKCKPDKVPDVSALLLKYQGRERALYEHICKKYGVIAENTDISVPSAMVRMVAIAEPAAPATSSKAAGAAPPGPPPHAGDSSAGRGEASMAALTPGPATVTQNSATPAKAKPDSPGAGVTLKARKSKRRTTAVSTEICGGPCSFRCFGILCGNPCVFAGCDRVACKCDQHRRFAWARDATGSTSSWVPSGEAADAAAAEVGRQRRADKEASADNDAIDDLESRGTAERDPMVIEDSPAAERPAAAGAAGGDGAFQAARPVLGVDIGRVLANDTRSGRTNADITPIEGAFPAMKRLAELFGPEHVHLISKATDSRARRLRSWLRSSGFWTLTGINEQAHLHFVPERTGPRGKGPKAEELKVSHFIDDGLPLLHAVLTDKAGNARSSIARHDGLLVLFGTAWSEQLLDDIKVQFGEELAARIRPAADWATVTRIFEGLTYLCPAADAQPIAPPPGLEDHRETASAGKGEKPRGPYVILGGDKGRRNGHWAHWARSGKSFGFIKPCDAEEPEELFAHRDNFADRHMRLQPGDGVTYLVAHDMGKNTVTAKEIQRAPTLDQGGQWQAGHKDNTRRNKRRHR